MRLILPTVNYARVIYISISIAKMKSVFALILLVEIFFGQGTADVIEDNKEGAMNFIAQCLDETGVSLEELKVAIKSDKFDYYPIDLFMKCYEETMFAIDEPISRHCAELNGYELMKYLECYQDILIDYLSDFAEEMISVDPKRM
ncbi:uncharacterized protein LOC116179677 [Photinus pyralis]|nr:uncharacterized protein LOC116172470 [Photinus pyralis]XP_031355351.1 uncharacterized protein LOC116179677 [Photinus pyralis]